MNLIRKRTVSVCAHKTALLAFCSTLSMLVEIQTRHRAEGLLGTLSMLSVGPTQGGEKSLNKPFRQCPKQTYGDQKSQPSG